jgi:enoyl-CoA hydratase
MFSAGVDLLRVLDEGASYVEKFIDTLSVFCESIFAFSKPLVAAVNGHAVAGGCVLACMADRRLMASGNVRVGVPELLVGVPFPAAPLEIMRLVIPPRHLGEVLYGGATYEGQAAIDRGLIDDVVPADELMTRSVVAARTLAGLAPDAFRLTKRQLRQPSLDRMRMAAESLDDEVRRVWSRPDTLEAIRVYVSRTFKRPR